MRMRVARKVFLHAASGRQPRVDTLMQAVQRLGVVAILNGKVRRPKRTNAQRLARYIERLARYIERSVADRLRRVFKTTAIGMAHASRKMLAQSVANRLCMSMQEIAVVLEKL